MQALSMSNILIRYLLIPELFGILILILIFFFGELSREQEYI